LVFPPYLYLKGNAIGLEGPDPFAPVKIALQMQLFSKKIGGFKIKQYLCNTKVKLNAQ
jgi:hypothetical protein